MITGIRLLLGVGADLASKLLDGLIINVLDHLLELLDALLGLMKAGNHLVPSTGATHIQTMLTLYSRSRKLTTIEF